MRTFFNLVAPRHGATRHKARMTKKSYSWIPGILLAMALLGISAAQPANQAGLVVRFGDDRVETFCVAFEEAEITGLELLQRAGLALEVEALGMGASICRVEDVGCAANNCFCQCRGGTCEYWSYWQLQDGEWRYAVAGASLSTVADGEVEGWSWGPGSVNEAISPPVLSFEQICMAEGETEPVAPAATSGSVSIAATSGAADSAQEPAAEADSGETEVRGSLLLLGVFVLVVAVLVLAAFRGRQR